ncbi:MAG: oxidoreductase [Myxococcales bacterium]|nr:oxidoreductase [Myxococcales bacterium]
MELPDLSGKTVLITGANSGIGFEAARAFAGKSAEVVLACRSLERAQRARERIVAEHPSARLELLELDLASLGSVRAAAERFVQQEKPLHVLCNNAGVMAIPRQLTEDGFEMQLGVNHFGHFALTGLLLDALKAADSARVVTVTSLMHRGGRLRLDDLAAERGYHKWSAYGASKLANLLFAFELERRLERAGLAIASLACHPGYADTDLQQVGPRQSGSKLQQAFYRTGNLLFAQSPERGAWPTLAAATDPALRGGELIGPGGLGALYGAPRPGRAARRAYDAELARRLWEVSEQRTGVEYRFG